jgi:GMP synthase (glutamine-hydrolysing)
MNLTARRTSSQSFLKDEVREVGRQLGLPDEIILRHPLPGTGTRRKDHARSQERPWRPSGSRDSIVVDENEEGRALLQDMADFRSFFLPLKTVG